MGQVGRFLREERRATARSKTAVFLGTATLLVAAISATREAYVASAFVNVAATIVCASVNTARSRILAPHSYAWLYTVGLTVFSLLALSWLW